MQQLLSTKEVAKLLGVNEKMIYTLITEKGLPATKITGKWLFPTHLVEQWVETRTINYPSRQDSSSKCQNVLIFAGSNDMLLDRTLSLFMRTHSNLLAPFANLGSMGGIKALRQGLCHVACSHLVQEEGESGRVDYNFAYAEHELERLPAVVNFCKRRQGLLLAPGNPKKIGGIKDLTKPGMRIVNRAPGTGTRLLLDRECARLGISPDKLVGYTNEAATHMALGLEILAGRADAGMGIQAAATALDLDFIPFTWERFDLLIPKDQFFDKDIQRFLGLLQDPAFKELAQELTGYDIAKSGKMVYPNEGE